MSIFEAIVLGLVQGLTEFILVSSSGHLLIFHEILGTGENSLAFDVALHVGTLAALLLYFRNDLVDLIKHIHAKNKQGRLARLLIAATIPAAVAGLLFSGYIDDNLRTPFIAAVSLATVGVLMIIVDKLFEVEHGTDKEVSTRQGMGIGIAQAAALIPGVSRSGATMTAGLAAGLGREQAARFSFLLAIPIIAGSALGILLKESDGLDTGGWLLTVGVLSAFLSGLMAIKFFLRIVARVGLKPFGLYRIVVAVVVLFTLV